MEPNGIFLNKSFQQGAARERGSGSGKDCATKPTMDTSEVTRSSSSSSFFSSSSSSGTMKGTGWGSSQEAHCKQHHHHMHQNLMGLGQRRNKNKRPLRMTTEGDCLSRGREEDMNNNGWGNNNYRSSVASSSTTATMSSSPIVEDSGSTRGLGLKKIKSKSGEQGEGWYSNFTKISKSSLVEEDRKDEGERMESEESHGNGISPTNLATQQQQHPPLTWKLPSFLCLPFTSNDNNNSYMHLVSSSSSKSAGIFSLTSLVFVVMAVLLASGPATVMSATPSGIGEPSPVTDDIINNDVTGHDYPTTSSSIMPVKLQTIQFTSSEGTTPDDAALFLSSSATGRTTGGSSGPSVTHQSIEGIKQEPSMNDFAGWKDEDTLTAHSGEVEHNDKMEQHHLIHQDDEDDLLHKEYEFKTGFPELQNETREALQEEGSNHQPVVFVGGSGYVPPNSIRTRPSLDADPLYRPVAETRYPVPLQSAWDRNYRNPFNMTRVQHIEAECQDDSMKIRVAFNGSFHGLVYSSGYSYDPDCVYINGTGRDYYEYIIKLNRCGTLGASNHVEGRREPSKNFMWNTVTVQYNPMIEEEWDEHFKVTCEYGYDFWKTVTFPFLDVEVATGNPVVFTLTPPECYMEVRYGFGTTGTRVGGPVRVGDPLTLMINMRSQYDGFDIVVNDCYAHNGATKRIQLIDHYGCPVDSKLMSPFRGTWSHTSLYETQVYAYLKTFRFTGSPALYIECDVRMCHGQCPAQPCYWRNVKSLSKRSTDSQQMTITDSEKNSTLTSENLSLFQALRVLQEDEDTEALKTNLDTQESVCMKTGAFTAMIGLSTFILVILTVSTMIMCFRLRRVKVIEERETAADILRPYSHHVSPPAQPSHHRHHHWASAKPR